MDWFSGAVKYAGALGMRRRRLTAELKRYGIDGFQFVDNEYSQWVRRPCCTRSGARLQQSRRLVVRAYPHHRRVRRGTQVNGYLRQKLAEGANAAIMRLRALYRVAQLPRETNKFMTTIRHTINMTRDSIIAKMEGWTLHLKVRRTGSMCVPLTLALRRTGLIFTRCGMCRGCTGTADPPSCVPGPRVHVRTPGGVLHVPHR